MNIGVIGTAGRGDDYNKLCKKKFKLMVETVDKIIFKLHHDPVLISGGAAWADHIAVILHDSGPCYNTKLHLPAPFKDGKFQACSTSSFDPGKVANYYHKKFSEKCGFDSLKQIAISLETGGMMMVTNGFKPRNTKIAEESDILIALTFGEKNKVKDGGTHDCCEKYLKLGKNKLWHIDLNTMTVYENGIV